MVRDHDAFGQHAPIDTAQQVRQRGRVLDERGRPVPGAVVRAVDLITLDQLFTLQPNWFSAARSDAKGRFRLGGVPDVPLAVLVKADGYYDSVVTARKVSSSRSPGSRAIESRKLTNARCGISTPFGLPVEPDV